MASLLFELLSLTCPLPWLSNLPELYQVPTGALQTLLGLVFRNLRFKHSAFYFVSR